MARSGDEGLEQRLDRWVEAGRQFVDGVSGARPGSRSPGRATQRRSNARLNPAELGRWVENKLDWLLEDDTADDWREPWQSPRPSAVNPSPPRDPQPRGRRRPLEAISRRAAVTRPADDAASDWPTDDLFSVPRWQRQPPQSPQPPTPDPGPESFNRGPQASGRPLPRSSRRR